MTDTQAPRIAGYTLIRELGRGGMAVVYRATQDSLGREVALKVMSAELARDPTYAARFLREGRVVANLRHRNILMIYDLGVAEGRPYLAMEYVSGGAVSTEAGHLPPREVLACIRDIARALDHAHTHGVVHRDIKPENILRGPDGSYLLADFGIARVTEATSALTLEGSTLGTPQYMSPEQWRGEPLDGRADLYSLGVVMYQLLSGRVPYTGTDGWAIGMQHMTSQVPALSGEYAGFQHLLDRLLAKKPEDRFASGAQLAVAADALAASLPADPPARFNYSAATVAMPTPPPTPSSMAAARSPSGPTPVQPMMSPPSPPVSEHHPTLIRKAPNTGLLIGGIVGAAFLLLLCVVGLMWWAVSKQGKQSVDVADDSASQALLTEPDTSAQSAAQSATQSAALSAPPSGDTAASQDPEARRPDPVARARLDRLGIKYEIDADQDFQIVLPTQNGRTQMGWLRSVVESTTSHQIREIWSPAFRNEGNGALPGDLANRLLEDAHRHKLGGWVLQGKQVVFVVKIDNDATDDQLGEAIRLAFISADAMEQELSGAKDEY